LVFLAYCSGRYFLKKYEIKWKAIIFTSLAILGFSFGLTLNFDQGMVILFATLIVPGLLGALGIFKEWNRER
jgi:hypothetical protein